MSGRPKFYITTAISYPNGQPHIGHAYEAIATDAIARFEIMHRQEITGPHPRARHLDEVIGLVRAGIGDASGVCRRGNDIRPGKMICADIHPRRGSAIDVLHEIRIVVALRQRVQPIAVVGIVLVVIPRRPAATRAQDDKLPVLIRADVVPSRLRDVSLPR